MNGFLRHSTLLGSREDGTMVASGFLQKSAVRNWLGGIVPAWTMLDQKSFEALLLPPSPPVGAIRFATHFSPRNRAIGRRATASTSRLPPQAVKASLDDRAYPQRLLRKQEISCRAKKR